MRSHSEVNLSARQDQETAMPTQLPRLQFHPVTPDRWKDFEELFGENGACAGCWCMWWRLSRAEFTQKHYAGNKRAIKKIITAGREPGILAYADGEPIGWCAIAPREAYPSLDRSNVLQRVDDQPVWSVTCFYVARGYRKHGVTRQLLEAAVQFAQHGGAQIVEGYPIDTGGEKKTGPSIFTGLVSTFEQAGFVEVARRSPTRPIMRYFVHHHVK
jgi:GNAT superfamily N-acetyltransferase